MGSERRCTVVLDGTEMDAKVLLESGELIIRGTARAVIPFGSIELLTREDDALVVHWNGRVARIEAGAEAARWEEKIRHPKSVVEKLGVKNGERIAIAGDVDADFLAQLRERGIVLLTDASEPADALFFAVADREALAQLPQLRERLTPRGALWIIRPKGAGTISESDVRERGRAAGLVDVKVVRLSATHTAEKFVIPLDRR